MKKLSILLGICLLLLSAPAWGQSNYLIRIDGINQAVIDQIKGTAIEVYAKASDFWIAGAGKNEIELLKERGIPFQIVDEEAHLGEHYFVLPRPGETIRARLPEIEAKSRILMTELGMALVKGDPRQIEELAASGFALRRIQKEPLPLEPAASIPSYLESLSRVYNPLIDSIVNKVDQDQLLSLIDDFTGEDTVLIGGMEDSIKTRYSWSQDVPKAADYLKERFQEMGIPVEFDTFQVELQTFLTDVACSPGGQKAWCINYWGDILKTTDGGGFWDIVGGNPYPGLWDIFRFDDNTLWAVGYGGTIIKSSDGGDTWQLRTTPEYDTVAFHGCYFYGPDFGWVVGWTRILFTATGGAGWVEQLTLPNLRLRAVDFVDRYRGWVVGEGGTIYYTNTGGFEWFPQSSSLNTVLYDVDFVDSLNGWVVGEMGWALYTTDGGVNWIEKSLMTSADLRRVDFVDSLHGWILAHNGDVFQTNDGGVNWVRYSTGVYGLRGMEFADTLTGWACGPSGIIKTVDGGENWFYQFESVGPRTLWNVVATINGLCYPGKEFLITAHYDATSEDPYNWTPGADDNASGVIALLTAASVLKDYSLSHTVKFVAFSGEEQGLLGSAAYAEEAYDRGDTILGVLNFDMIAYDGNSDGVMEVHCGYPEGNQALGDILITAITDYGLNLVPEKLIEDASWASDHASFWSFNFPAISGGEDHQDFNPYYHTTNDRVSAFDTSYYFDFAKAAVAGIATLADPFILGDVNGDMVLGPGDVVYLIDYLYRHGSAPDPLEAGDCNCDGTVGPGDVVFLINYLFRNGPPPSC